MKRWMKYMVVTCCFFIMTGVFLPDSGNSVKASEAASVSDNNAGTVSWTVSIIYDVDGKLTKGEIPSQSSGMFGFTTASAPAKDGHEFLGWLCSVGGENVKDSGGINGSVFKPDTSTDRIYNCNDYNGATITFTAQWSENTGTVVPGGDAATPDSAAGTIFSSDGTFPVTAGLEYRLDTGTWTVDNGSDGCQYVGGNSFYVKESREYTFTKN